MFDMWPILLQLLTISSAALAQNTTENACSFHQGASCDKFATCLEDDTDWWCQCPEGSTGDGLILGNGCQFEETPCAMDSVCHIDGYCAANTVCRCKEGYSGDGFRICQDEDECSMGVCSPNATCQNSPGSFTCVCDIGYAGNGIECQRTCELNDHCGGYNNFCNTTLSVCQCRPGYEGDAFIGCTDIDECATNQFSCGALMHCKNVNGTYECPCDDGYWKADGVCLAKDRNCHEIKLRVKWARDGDFEVDPDGPGGVPAFVVYCDFRATYGVTWIKSTLGGGQRVNINNKDKAVTYEQSIEQIKALMDTSEFCYQEMKYRCNNKVKLMNGQTFWEDGDQRRHYTWGGATDNNKCACGQLETCTARSDDCYCNGLIRGKIDQGRIFNQTHLPITKTYFGGMSSTKSASLKIGHLKCGPKTFDFAKSCHEYKWSGKYWVRKDTPMFIDVDGPDQSCPPVLVHCNMEQFINTGVSVFHHTHRGYNTMTQPGRVDFSYAITDECMRKAIDNSAFCSQHALYQCKNSRLYNYGDPKGFLRNLNGPIPFFAGGFGQADMCGCGVSGSCEDRAYNCNCDITDGVERLDMGLMTEKEYLPIAGVEFNEIDADSSGTYSVGPLMCSEVQFGIPPSCLAARARGETISHNTLIDPDQDLTITITNNLPPFNVYCEFNEEGISAKTVVYHSPWGKTELSKSDHVTVYSYYYVMKQQLQALKVNSAYCFQSLEVDCKYAALHSAAGEDNFMWYNLNGLSENYFNGNGASLGCACSGTDSCDGGTGSLCNCDVRDNTARTDLGVLTNMNDLPVLKVVYQGLEMYSFVNLTVGPLICTESFSVTDQCQTGAVVLQEDYPTCEQINSKFRPLKKSFGLLPNQEFFIDPDNVGGVEPFLVSCWFPTGETIVPIGGNVHTGNPFPNENSGPECFNVSYSGGTVSPEQVQALVNSSAFCEQRVTYTCRNSPFSGHITYKTCDGREQYGWGGSQGEPGCGCGVTGDCDKCNCDNNAAYLQTDRGYIRARHALPVCQVCFDLDPVGIGEPAHEAKVVIDRLVCFPHTGHIHTSCQDVRNEDKKWHTGEADVITEIDVDGEGDTPPLPIKCLLTGPIGTIVIDPKEPVVNVTNATEIRVEYFFLDFAFIRQVIETSVYCEQSLHIECFGDSSFNVDGTSAWAGPDGTYQEYWAGNTGGIGCENGECNCGFQDGRERVDGGLMTDQDILPVTTIKLPDGDGVRRITISSLKCYDVYKDCQEILEVTEGKNPPTADDTWPVDPDRAGGVDAFIVKCDFHTHKNMGITLVYTETGTQTVTGAVEPGSQSIPISYPPTPAQIHALAIQSTWCYQTVSYLCTHSPLLTGSAQQNSYLTGFNGQVSNNFGAGDTSLLGCACQMSGTCPADSLCRCDVESAEPVLENGVVLNEDLMPITMATFGGQTDPGATAAFNVGHVLCGPAVFDVVEDCEEARQLGMPSGDTLIRPSEYLSPIMVYCQMTNEYGITILGTTVTQTPANVTEYPSGVAVDYWEASTSQITALVARSQFCQQPVKYDCYKTKFLEGSKAFWRTLSGGDEQHYFFGHANPWENKCSCGHDRLCGGTDGRTAQRSRKCNCDAGDAVWRRDAGIITTRNVLPVSQLGFKYLPDDDAQGMVTVGNLYCAPQEFDLNECEMDFHDCDKNAECINLPGRFECRCKPGYQGWGRDRNVYFPTGRVCYDDDECALNKCGWSANCENLEGSYLCHCKDGFTQETPQSCKDIDECSVGNTTCDENAHCINTPGSYLCRCNHGFRGDGQTCEAVGICTCFGDPHCESFDGHWLHFQGACTYTMVRNNCGTDNEPNFFEVLQKNWRRGSAAAEIAQVSWVKEITVTLGSTRMELKQGLQFYLNGILTSLPFSASGFTVYYTVQNIEIMTDFGLHIKWNGKTTVDVILSKDFSDKTCGLCGNFNDDAADDWTTGPECPPAGIITDNNNLFGQSWTVVGNTEDPECSIDCGKPPEEDVCTGEQKELASEYCLMVFSRSGRFSECLDLISDESWAGYMKGCQYDLCMVGDFETSICSVAEKLVQDCQDHYSVTITTWRSTTFCRPECGPNEGYTTCGYPSQQANCAPDQSTVPMEQACEEGCICPSPFMLSGTQCVPPDQCGCYVDGVYYTLNETVISDECNSKKICGDDGQLSTMPLTGCRADENCTIKDGVRDCHCLEGTIRFQDGTCSPDPCYMHNCTGNSVCVPSEDNSYDCICTMGFTGLCNKCDDVDECATDTHGCDGRAKCINTQGSFVCLCEEGLIAMGTICEDQDECALATHDCDDNAQCVNTFQGFDCVCCMGYTQGDNGTCVEADGEEPGAKCCACVGENCNIPGKVCGSDFVTYASERAMVISACLNENEVTVNYRGDCQDSCGSVVCEGFKTCKPDVLTAQPICSCDGCTPIELEIKQEVCDNENNRFETICQFEEAMCITESESPPIPITQCEGLGSGNTLTKWSEWSPCSVMCGKGEKTRTREWANGSPSPGVQAGVALTSATECYQPPCPGGPCVVDVCTGNGEECVEVDGSPVCECPECTNGGVEPVCALIGQSIASYLSACKAQRVACLHNLPYEILYDDKCGVFPTDCSRFPLFKQHQTDDACYSMNEVNVWTCSGGCGQFADKCCDSEQDSIQVDVICPSGPNRTDTVPIVKRCFCRDED